MAKLSRGCPSSQRIRYSTSTFTAGEGPVRLSQRIPYVPRQASNGNIVDENGEFTTASGAGAVKSIWFIPPETRDGITLIPVFVAVKDL